MALFLTLLGRFKNHLFYERKRMKKLALFLPDVKKIFFLLLIQKIEIHAWLSVPEVGHFLTCISFCIVSKIETIETIQNSV
jgi:hypothetical protein